MQKNLHFEFCAVASDTNQLRLISVFTSSMTKHILVQNSRFITFCSTVHIVQSCSVDKAVVIMCTNACTQRLVGSIGQCIVSYDPDMTRYSIY